MPRKDLNDHKCPIQQGHVSVDTINNCRPREFALPDILNLVLKRNNTIKIKECWQSGVSPRRKNDERIRDSLVAAIPQQLAKVLNNAKRTGVSVGKSWYCVDE